MPNYAFRCSNQTCQQEFERVLRLSEYQQAQVCPQCGGESQRKLEAPTFILAGDGWPGKNIRIQGQMTAKNRHLTEKSREMPAGQKLVPNVGGEEVESWSEAKKLAASKGKDTSSYDQQIMRESGGKA